jgi:serine/threonine kinase PknH
MDDSTPGGEAPGKRWTRMRWIFLGSAAIVAIVVVLVIVFLRSTKPSAVTAGRLDSALLDSTQINTIVGTDDMQISEPMPTPTKPTIALSKPQCLGALDAAQAPTYLNSGYTQFRSTEARPLFDKVDHYVAQAVAIFPDADKAGAFVKHSADQWKTCAKATVVVMLANKSINVWTIDTVNGYPPSITVSESRREVGWRCQRAVRAVSNAVIDATACGSDITNQGSSVADRIAANMSK